MHEQLLVIGFSFFRDLMALSPFIVLGAYVFSGIMKSKTEQEWQTMHDENNYQVDKEIYKDVRNK